MCIHYITILTIIYQLWVCVGTEPDNTQMPLYMTSHCNQIDIQIDMQPVFNATIHYCHKPVASETTSPTDNMLYT